MNENVDRIAQFFVGQKLLITGGTGLVGQVFVEKLLRLCPNIGAIFLLIRNKKDKKPDERLKEIFSDKLYESVKLQYGLENILKKCKMIEGDVMELGLGISDEDRAMLAESVTVIYNFAATTRFDEHITKSTLINLRGTRELLSLAKSCKDLKLFLHMSTAYSFTQEKNLLEKFYRTPDDPHKIINLVETLNEEVVGKMQKKLLGNFVNSYTFTKALAEDLCAQSKELPILIVRPSILTPTKTEPIAGWVNSVQGFISLMVAISKGVIRIVHLDLRACPNFVPIDVIASALCVSTWNYVALKDTSRQVIHYVSSYEPKISFMEVYKIGIDLGRVKIPFNQVFWYPRISCTKSKVLFKVQSVLFHYIPAVFADFLMFLLGYKPVMKKVQKKVTVGLEAFSYYLNNQWNFANDNLSYLQTILNDTEKQNYKIGLERLDLRKYLENNIIYLRKNIYRESDDGIPKARRMISIMYYADLFFKVGLILFILYFIFVPGF